MLATTATANQRVTADVAAQLGSETVTLRGSLARASLRLAVVPGLSTLEGYAWVTEALRTLPGSGIVYVLTVAETERVAAFLADQGLDVAAYSGQSDNREAARGTVAAQRDQGAGRDLGAGDGLRQARPRVLHPPGLAGVAGGLLPADRPGRAGAGRRHRGLGARTSPTSGSGSTSPPSGIPTDEQVERILDALADGSQSLGGIETATGIRRGRLETLLKILAVDDVVAKTRDGWEATGRAWYFDEPKWSDLHRVRAAEADLMRGYAHGAGCLMQFLQRALDDPDPRPCGRCSVCDGRLPAPGSRPSARAGGGGEAVPPRPGRGDRAPEALGERSAWPQGQDRGRGAGSGAGVR